ncbi:TonB-dependent receptor [Sphingomonas aracearum]|uniref:TonB-dependent receptor n=1 Tax=Sphingomonas aracearum TaxID=2283317 RepID=A0A369W159_9SPHN|nr:TonB-dependent receptor [Sphingomonas aracearum]RDE05821.1 TonB-dependent receptor [Sphingomonas aracearum]
MPLSSAAAGLCLGLPTAAAALALAAPAWAQEAAAQNDADVIVRAQQAQKQVTSDGDLGALGRQEALATPFNVSTYTAQLVLDQQSETLGDVLENDPSVRTTYGFGNQSEQFVIRGFALNGDDIAIDGLYGITPRQLVSPEPYESVQVLNGASAFLFGASPGGSGIGGTINLTPKRAERTLLRATASYGANSVVGGNVDLGTRFGPDRAFGLRVNGVYRNGDTAIDDEHRKVTVASASFDFRKGPGRFFLDFGYEDQQARQARPTVTLDANVAVPRVPGAGANYAQPWTYTHLRDIYALARAELDVAAGWTLYAAAGFRDGSETGEYSSLTVTDGATGAATASRLYVPREDNNEAGQAGIRGRFTVAGISNQFNAGASVSYQENRNSFAFGDFPASVRTSCGTSALNFCTNLYAPAVVGLPPFSSTPGFVAGSFTTLPRVSSSELKSVYVSDTIGLFDDRVLITGGLRRQNIVVDAFDRTSLVRTTRYDESRTTPVVGVVLRPARTLSFYGNRIEGLAQGPTAPTSALVINPGEVFAPFKSVQYEVGAKLELRGLTGTLALYQTRQPSTYNAPTAMAGLSRFVVDGEQRNRGIELSLNGEPTNWLRFLGGVTINEAEITRSLNGLNNGKDAVGVPDYQVNFGAEVSPAALKGLTFTGGVVMTGEQAINIPTTTSALQELPDWTRFDLGARYVFVADEHPVTLRVSAENIDNRRYWYSAFGGYLLQGSPRTVKASLTFEY